MADTPVSEPLKPKHETVVVDGVLRYPRTGIKVLIVGAGPGGYLAALECWRKGHEVRVVEKSLTNSPMGDLVALGPSALSTLKYYPSMLSDYQSCSWDSSMSFRSFDGQHVYSDDEWEWNRDDAPNHAAWPIRIRSVVTRSGVANMFYHQCLRLSIPVEFGVHIVDFVENEAAGKAAAVDADGKRYSADLVIAADGLGTKSHKVITGESIRAFPTGYSICRIFYFVDKEKSPKLAKMLEDQIDRPEFRAHTGNNHHCMFMAARDAVCLMYTVKETGEAVETTGSWAETISSEELMRLLPDMDSWNPLLVEAFHSIPKDKIIKWQLCWREPQLKWTSPSGHIVQLGDAAHAFVPTSGAGATSALEDAISLAECLRLAGKDAIHIGSRVHEQLRVRRVSVLQRVGFRNRRAFHGSGGVEETHKGSGESGLIVIGKWVWTHNPETYATQRFNEARAHVETGAPFADTNLPVGFKWEPWTMLEEIEQSKKGIKIPDLKNNGDWTIR